MLPKLEADFVLEDGTEVYGKICHVLVWVGKPMSGHWEHISGQELVEVRSVREAFD